MKRDYIFEVRIFPTLSYAAEQWEMTESELRERLEGDLPSDADEGTRGIEKFIYDNLEDYFGGDMRIVSYSEPSRKVGWQDHPIKMEIHKNDPSEIYVTRRIRN